MSMIESFINKLEETRRNAFLTIGDRDNEKLGEAYQIISRVVEDSIKMIRFLSAKLSESVLNDGWHVVADGDLPEEKGVYLVTYHPCHFDYVADDIYVGTDTFCGKKWSKNKYQKVIAWMPLPDPYKKEVQHG